MATDSLATSSAVAHGALDHAELARLGLVPADLLDFSSNLNPFGPPPGVRGALSRLEIGPYPDRSCLALRRALAARHQLAPEQILPGNGANELIHLVARALLAPGETALVAGPTYGEYAHACRLSGAQVVEWRDEEAGGFALDAVALAQAIDSTRPRLTWLCTPNNPTGADLAPGQVRALAALCAGYGGLLVADRAYAAFTRGGPRAPDRASEPFDHGRTSDPLDQSPPHNLLRLHSLTKSYALAGLRLGYLLGKPDLIERVAAYQPAWSASSPAQAAGLAALSDESFLLETLPRLWAASDQILDGLRALRLTARRGELPFMLVHVGDAAATRAALLARGCAVRDCASFGLPAWVRLAPRRPEENARLLEAWRAIV